MVTSQLVISGLALVQAAININIHFHSPHVSVPGWIKRLMFGPVSSMLCLDYHSYDTSAKVCLFTFDSYDMSFGR